MKILIVDDTPQKSRIIAEYLRSRGVDQIQFANNAVKAKDILEKEHFDLMFLDALLPYREDQEARTDVGITLLNEIRSRAKFKEPHHIAIITEYANLAEEYGEKLIGKMISFIRYAVGDDSWQNSVDGLLEELGRRYIKGILPPQIDVCFICALERPEARELLKILDIKSDAIYSKTGFMYYYGAISIGSARKNVAVVIQNQMGSVESAIVTTKMLEQEFPWGARSRVTRR